MLRIAVRFRIDGAVLPLPDPWFGKGFVHERAGNRLRIWSADAADSVAVGKARWNRSDLRDVVLEIGR
jgi:hypothetical protein